MNISSDVFFVKAANNTPCNIYFPISALGGRSACYGGGFQWEHVSGPGFPQLIAHDCSHRGMAKLAMTKKKKTTFENNA